ncbi:MAG TPA: hypothetical protein DD990_29725 [Cyanobacteria bacterium UBA11368]|nr:hypothetical protein [Cyanobacteria bacterium UBA11368]
MANCRSGKYSHEQLAVGAKHSRIDIWHHAKNNSANASPLQAISYEQLPITNYQPMTISVSKPPK